MLATESRGCFSKVTFASLYVNFISWPKILTPWREPPAPEKEAFMTFWLTRDALVHVCVDSRTPAAKLPSWLEYAGFRHVPASTTFVFTVARNTTQRFGFRCRFSPPVFFYPLIRVRARVCFILALVFFCDCSRLGRCVLCAFCVCLVCFNFRSLACPATRVRIFVLLSCARGRAFAAHLFGCDARRGRGVAMLAVSWRRYR